MRPSLALLILAAPVVALSACADDPCLGVDGTCVALTVQSAGAGGSEIDGLDIALTGAATGRRIAPPFASVATLPRRVALGLAKAKSGTLHVEVVGVRFGQDVGAGSTDVEIVVGQAAEATVVLGTATIKTCRDPARPTSCGEAGCWPEGTDCDDLVTCGGAPRACTMGSTGHCATDGKFYCCPADHPVFCQVTVQGCTGCWTAGSACSGAIVKCPDGKCHTCATGTFDCATMKCR